MITYYCKKLTLLSPILFFLILNLPSQAQTPSLDDKYQEIMENSETYEVYKVIRGTRLNEFWGEVRDSIEASNTEIAALKGTVSSLNTEISTLNDKIDDLSKDLEASNEVNDSISFLGIGFSKATYHIMVWVIIAGLVTAIVVLTGMYRSSNALTQRTVKEHKGLEAEFESHKSRSHEQYLKLKRDLQTAVNKIEDLRKSKSSRSGVGETTN